MDMLCLMFDCDQRGVLATAGVPWTDEEIAGAVRGDKTQNLADVQELLAKGVAKRDKRGAIYSGRMVRDEAERQNTKERVRVHRAKRNTDVTPVVTEVKRPCTNSDSECNSEVEVRFDLEAFDPEDVLRGIQNAHPRPEDTDTCRQYILEAIERRVKKAQCSRQVAAEWLLARTEQYRLATDNWEQKQFITKATRWFQTHQYEEDPQFWERKKGNGEDFRSKIDRAVRQMADQDAGAD